MRIGTSFLSAGVAAGLLINLGVARAQSPAPTLTLDLGSGVTLDLVLVKAGAFRQGSPPSEEGRADDEAEREVTLTADYYIGVHEVTVGQFGRFVAETSHKTEAEKGTSGGFGWTGQGLEQRPSFNWENPGFPQTDRHPVTIVTFDDAQAFARWLSNRSGRAVTLPTEAQWEFAARAGSTSAYPSGSSRAEKPAALGWSKANAGGGTHPVGEKSPNGIGLFDLAGNVAEWCLDWYGPYDAATTKDPLETRQNLGDKPRRVLRGGSWLRDPKNGRSAARYRSTPGSRNADNGFRIVVSTAAPGPASSGGSSTAAPADVPREESTGLSNAGVAGFLLGVLAVGGGFILILWRVVTWLMGGAGTSRVPGVPGGIKTQMTPDGFTLKAPKVPLGHRVHYRYVVGGKAQTGSVVYSGDPDVGQTVYTGAKPSSVVVFAVTAPGEPGPIEKTQAVARPVEDREMRRTDDDSFRGYPSAYR